jgi:hypothetical protein
MEPPKVVFESLLESVEVYGKTTLELTKLKIQQASTIAVTSLITQASVILMFGLAIIFLNISIALVLGEWCGKSYYGFFIISAVWLIGGLVFQRFIHHWIKKSVNHLIAPNS